MHGPTILLVASLMVPIFAVPVPAPHINDVSSSVSVAPRDESFVNDLFRNVLRRASIIEALPGLVASKRGKGVKQGGKRDETLSAEKRGKGVKQGGKREESLNAEKRGKGVKQGGKRDEVQSAEKRGKGVKQGGKRDETFTAEKRGKGVKQGGKRGEGVVREGKREPSVNESGR
ncbi:hypothetical protein HBH42_085210 [Parastagonospora nodorum]|nr:hypothetical protein HBH42_085210 [Parastagonospora nodorum]